MYLLKKGLYKKILTSRIVFLVQKVPVKQRLLFNLPDITILFGWKNMQDLIYRTWDQERRTCEPKDILPIAFGQIASENKLAKRADKVLICDTDLLKLKLPQEYYGGYVDPLLEKGARESKYDSFFTYIDTPWEADDLRDRPNQREQMFQAFKNALEDNNRPYILLKGDEKNRLNIALAIDKILFKR